MRKHGVKKTMGGPVVGSKGRGSDSGATKGERGNAQEERVFEGRGGMGH